MTPFLLDGAICGSMKRVKWPPTSSFCINISQTKSWWFSKTIKTIEQQIHQSHSPKNTTQIHTRNESPNTSSPKQLGANASISTTRPISNPRQAKRGKFWAPTSQSATLSCCGKQQTPLVVVVCWKTTPFKNNPNSLVKIGELITPQLRVVIINRKCEET